MVGIGIGSIVLAGILSQTVYGYSGLYVILLVADIVAILLTVILIKPAKQEA